MLWICLACTTAYSVGAPACPHCGSTEHRLSTDPVEGEGSSVLVGEPGPELDVPKGKSLGGSGA